MRKLFLFFAVVPCVALLAGCPKKKDEGVDGGDDAAPAAAVEVDAAGAVAAPAAKNSADIARFPAGEKAVVDDAAKTLDLAQARTGPKSGGNVAVLKIGTDPFKIAEFQDCFLVTFADPKDATATLMGWIPKTAFTAAAIRDAGPLDAAVDAAVVDAGKPNPFAVAQCPAGQDGVNLGSGNVCRKKCTTDKDCKTPSPGACANAKHQLGKTARVCANELP